VRLRFGFFVVREEPEERRKNIFVIPAKAGIHRAAMADAGQWTPAFAGVTEI
jgi:hypothetical protein